MRAIIMCLIVRTSILMWTDDMAVHKSIKGHTNLTVRQTPVFECRDSLVSDDWREMILTFHNDKRRILSSGQQQNKDGTNLKPAKRMNELIWECNLERQARDGAAQCGSFTLANKGVNQELFKSSGKCDIMAKTKDVLNKWWNEVKTVGLSDDRKFAVGLENFANMAFHKTTAFACSYARCPGGMGLLCLYEQRGAKADIVLYPGVAHASKACSGCSDTAPCVNRLCRAEFNHAEEAPLFCNLDGMTKDMSETALNMHNYYRRLLANGWAEDKVSVYAPPAKQMLSLRYDCGDKQSLAYEAAKKSAECVYPPRAPQLPTRSQNYLKIDDYQINPLDALQWAIKTWWSELANNGVGTDTKYTAEMVAAGNLENYVNMAFDQTTLVGCGVETCKREGFTMVVCQYDKKIQEGDNIYEVGKTCSGCTSKKCDARGGLCAL
ncbi:hypothetical protein Y032_0024g961 [Ancylostoma ceylanicum]|uniref:SCP domain-containing protein n=2 Tax=Ancylostoma ceylanicum TaxID=53326 RepID=A0A016UYR7_9BILA|nr:hypothetical protein Y032_0024g961 [Ancylostoma ceylanicum]